MIDKSLSSWITDWSYIWIIECKSLSFWRLFCKALCRADRNLGSSPSPWGVRSCSIFWKWARSLLWKWESWSIAKSSSWVISSLIFHTWSLASLFLKKIEANKSSHLQNFSEYRFHCNLNEIQWSSEELGQEKYT